MVRSVVSISVIVLAFVSVARAKNILFLTGLPSPSHHIWNREITNGLAARGHNVTVLSTDLDSTPPLNVHYLLLNDIYEKFHKDYMETMFDAKQNTNPFTELKELHDAMIIICEFLIETNGFARLLAYPDHFPFDLVIYDFTIGACLLPFLHKFNYPPLVGVSAYNIPAYTSETIGGHHYYAYVRHNNLPSIDGPMNIFQRALNMLIHTFETLYLRHYVVPFIDNLHSEKFGVQKPSVGELQRRAILALVNIHPSFETAQPLPPNVIPVAGLHIKEANRLPADIELFVNTSRKGSVLVSFGTNYRSDRMPIERRNVIIEALREFPEYHFVWKFESDVSAMELPKNVLIQRWLPQSDILAHANVKAFFTHSGQLSTQEAIWRGVPLLCMPFGFDQHQNAMKAKMRGVAEIVNFYNLSTNEIKSKLSKLLNDRKYADASKRLSKGFRDQKETPLERALWHLEWALRNPQPDHLTSPALELGHIAANNYDVVVLFTVAAMLAVVYAWKLFAAITRLLTRRPPTLNSIQKKIK